jgi:hypothetical protein
MVHDYADDHKGGHDVLFTEYVHMSSPVEGSHDKKTT